MKFMTEAEDDKILKRAIEEAIKQQMTPEEAAKLYSETIPDDLARFLSRTWGGVDNAKPVRDAGERIRRG
jgi:hypothetical protein